MGEGGELHMASDTCVPDGDAAASSARRPSEEVARFIEHCRVGKCLSPHTLRAYGSDLADFGAHIGGQKLVEVDRDSVRAYARVLFDQRNLKSTTVRRRIATLRVLYKWMEREELVPLSVFHRLDLSIRLPRRLPRALKVHEMRLLLAAADHAIRKCPATVRYEAQLMRFTIVCLFTTGLRIGELVAAGLSDVSAHDGTIQVRGKGNRERRVYLPGAQALSALAKYLAARARVRRESDNLLITSEGSAASAQFIRTRLRSLAERAGIARRVTPHMLRHTAASQLLEAGVDIRLVQILLGHSSIATTQIYTEVRDAALKERLATANTLQRLYAVRKPSIPK
jgi:integrase/recombinase XerC